MSGVKTSANFVTLHHEHILKTTDAESLVTQKASTLTYLQMPEEE